MPMLTVEGYVRTGELFKPQLRETSTATVKPLLIFTIAKYGVLCHVFLVEESLICSLQLTNAGIFLASVVVDFNWESVIAISRLLTSDIL